MVQVGILLLLLRTAGQELHCDCHFELGQVFDLDVRLRATPPAMRTWVIPSGLLHGYYWHRGAALCNIPHVGQHTCGQDSQLHAGVHGRQVQHGRNCPHCLRVHDRPLEHRPPSVRMTHQVLGHGIDEKKRILSTFMIL